MTKDSYSCPYDSKHITPRPLGALARHMAMTDDALHKDWRKRHGLPEKIENPDRKILSEVKQAIIRYGF